MKSDAPATETVKFDLESYLYGAGLMANVVAGAWIQSWYVDWIKNESILFPDDNTANNADEDWALETEEIKNWKSLSYATVALYGADWLLWAANSALGDDGSIIHKAFFFSLQIQRFVPLVSLYLIFTLNASYLPTDASYSAAAAAATNPNDMKYLFNPGQQNAVSQNYDDPTWINRRWVMFFAACFSFAATNYSFPALLIRYYMAAALAADESDETDGASEQDAAAEEAVAEEAVAQEEFFF